MTVSGRAHLVGIGGSGMSGLAKILLARGYQVSGSDLRASEYTELLARLGIPVSIGHRRENVPTDVSLIVRSAAVPDDNPELTVPGARVVKYARMLGELSREKETISVCGTHGKTTTTGMIASILEVAGLVPTYLLGSTLLQTGTNAAHGTGPHFVVESCEFDRSFLNLSPKYVVITNIEEDHLDYYRDLEEIVAAFGELCAKVPAEGHIFACADNPNAARVAARFKGLSETVALQAEADWKARDIRCEQGTVHFQVIKYGKLFDEFSLGVTGAHNVSNALLAIACATRLGVGKEFIQLALEQFRGTRRRMEKIGETPHGTPVVDDYAHHPTEIQATLRALKQRYAGRPIWCVFQPHQHSRTRMLLKELARCFADADVVLVPDIFAARDEPSEAERISSRDLVKAINDAGKPALYMASFDEIVEFVHKKVNSNSVVVTMGAGNIGEVARRIAGK